MTLISLWIIKSISLFNKSFPIVNFKYVFVHQKDENTFENNIIDIIYDINYFIGGFGLQGVPKYP